MEYAYYYEPSPPAIGGQSSMAVTNANPETSSSGRLNGSMRPAQMPLRRIHERGRIISASTMPPSLRSTVIEILAQVAWSDFFISENKRLSAVRENGPLMDADERLWTIFWFGSDFFEHPIAHGLLSTLSNLLSSREAARGSWSERALRSAPIRWGPVAASGSPPMRNARVRAMAFPAKVHRASLKQDIIHMLALFDVHSVSLHEQADSLQRIFRLHISALINPLSDSMPPAFGHNAISPGGLGAVPPRTPSICLFIHLLK